MPLSPIVSSIVSSIISAILEAPAIPPEQPQQVSVTRTFPSAALPGILAGAPELGNVVINGKILPTAPGLQIRNQQNRIMIPVVLSGADFPILYQMDANGLNVWRIWILTPAEVAALNIRPVTLPASLLNTR
jgi:hypothetical protein